MVCSLFPFCKVKFVENIHLSPSCWAMNLVELKVMMWSTTAVTLRKMQITMFICHIFPLNSVLALNSLVAKRKRKKHSQLIMSSSLLMRKQKAVPWEEEIYFPLLIHSCWYTEKYVVDKVIERYSSSLL